MCESLGKGYVLNSGVEDCEVASAGHCVGKPVHYQDFHYRLEMRGLLLLGTVLALRNQLFSVEPYIGSAGLEKVKLVYSLGSTILSVQVGEENALVDYTRNQTTKIGDLYYGSLEMSLKSTYLKWTLKDFGGQTSTCTTKLLPGVQITDPHEGSSCQATGCYASFQEDGWCDALCLNSACGYDGTDCENADVFGILECDPNNIANGVCNPECAGPLTFYDGGDCLNPCLKTGCPRSSLGNGICDQTCNNPECFFDRGDCATGCSVGCSAVQLGDGVCDLACNSAACDYDSGDCSAQVQPCAGQNQLLDLYCQPYTCVSLGCTAAMLANDICDQPCNNPICGYDNGECIKRHLCKNHGCDPDEDIKDEICDMECFYEECAYDQGDCDAKMCWSGCLVQFLGNGVCDEQCNVPQCRFDNGDCHSDLCAENCFPQWLGDHICDFACNYAHCQYDHGDCSSSAPLTKVASGTATIAGVEYQAQTECVRSVALLVAFTALVLI